MQLRDRDRLETQPREGVRGKGKPSQLEDWKSLKPKPPQSRGLVGLRFPDLKVNSVETK